MVSLDSDLDFVVFIDIYCSMVRGFCKGKGRLFRDVLLAFSALLRFLCEMRGC